jgi:hypothetical protein
MIFLNLLSKYLSLLLRCLGLFSKEANLLLRGLEHLLGVRTLPSQL